MSTSVPIPATKKKSWLPALFALALIADVVFSYYRLDSYRYFSKPLVVASLMVYFFLQTTNSDSSLKKLVLAALFFSWLGDILLMFESRKSIFFLLGLSAFLLAHIFYIIAFFRIRAFEKIKGKTLVMLLVGLYFAWLIRLLSPGLGEMTVPVWIYGLAICVMCIMAMHLPFIKNKTAGLLIAVGALLFVISDSVLAINKFHQPFLSAGVLIMLTYGLAQFLITEGMIRYLGNDPQN